MSRSEAQKAYFLEKIADAILDRGIAGSNLKALARYAGTSDRMLVYYFKDKTEMINATLDVLEARLSAALDEYVPAETAHFEPLLKDVIGILDGEVLRPYMVLRLEIAGLILRGNEAYRSGEEGLKSTILSWIKRQLNSATAIARDQEAKRILIYIDGYFSQV